MHGITANHEAINIVVDFNVIIFNNDWKKFFSIINIHTQVKLSWKFD